MASGGYVQAQVSVPRVELIHGVTDRFLLDVSVRAWYRPDIGTTRLPSFIHGRVSAEYHIQDIDPTCPGWSKRAADFLWVRVLKDSVRFEGTVAEDQPGPGGLIEISPADEAVAIERIRRQIAVLLATRFEATPHPVSQGIQAGGDAEFERAHRRVRRRDSRRIHRRTLQGTSPALTPFSWTARTWQLA